MIFVNDFWTITEVPVWMMHAKHGTDGMGPADTVFPAFLFIVGLSIPYAINSRLKKGDSGLKIWLHIASRSFALILMSTFLVNIETYGENSLVDQSVWEILVTVSFFLLWMDYKTPLAIWVMGLRVIGIVLMIVLAFIYKNNEGGSFSYWPLQWFGILGHIGWIYLLTGTIFLLSRGVLAIQVAAFLFFIFMGMAEYFGWLVPVENIGDYIWSSQNNALPAFTTAGIVVSLLYKRYTPAQKVFWLAAGGFAVLLIIFGLATRPIWGISKTGTTISWITVCTSISIAGFLFMVYITDVKKLTGWYNYIKPAGTATLTCYILTYLLYATSGILSIDLPIAVRTGLVGLGKSFIFALLVIWVAGLLQKRYLHLKL